MKLREVSICFFLSLVLVSCAPTLQQLAPAEAEQRWLPFLQDGKTTKEEVVLKLGTPSAQFQGERILTYRLAEDRGSRFEETKGLIPTPREIVALAPQPGQLVSAWVRGTYNLVLVFDQRGVLQKHSFIKVK